MPGRCLFSLSIKIITKDFLKRKDQFFRLETGEKVKLDQVVIFPVEQEAVFPEAFQNPQLKFMVISDRNVAGFGEEKAKNVERQKVYLDF